MSGPQSLFLLAQEIFSLSTDLIGFIPLTPLKQLLPKTFLSDTFFHPSVTDLGPEDPMFFGIVFLFERGHLQGMNNASNIKKAKLPKTKLTKIKVEQTQLCLFGENH